MTIKFRKFDPRDLEIISDFVKKLYEEDPEGKPASDQNIQKTFAELQKYPEKGTFYILEVDGQSAGYALLINFWSNEYGGNILTVDELYVDERFRGQGLGTKFMQFLIDEKPGDYVSIQLETTPSNERARRLYERLGFVLSENDHLIYDFQK